MNETNNHMNPTMLSVSLLPAVTVPFLSCLFYFVLFSEHTVSRLVYGGTKVFTIIWPVVCVTLIFRSGLPKLELRSKRHVRAIPMGVISGLLIVAATLVLMKTPIADIVIGGTSNIKIKAEQLGILNHYWSFAIFLSVIHSFIEEYYWRWFVYGLLRKFLTITAAVFLGGIAFAAHHVVVLTQYFPLFWAFVFGGAVGFGGIIWSLMLEKQRTLVGAWISHMIVDFGIMTIGYQILHTN